MAIKTDIDKVNDLVKKLALAEEVQRSLEEIAADADKIQQDGTIGIQLIVGPATIPLHQCHVAALMEHIMKVNTDAIAHTREMLHKVLDSPAKQVEEKMNPRINEIPPARTGAYFSEDRLRENKF